MTILLIAAAVVTTFIAEISVSKTAIRVWRYITYLLVTAWIVALIVTGDGLIVVAWLIGATLITTICTAAYVIKMKRQENSNK